MKKLLSVTAFVVGVSMMALAPSASFAQERRDIIVDQDHPFNKGHWYAGTNGLVEVRLKEPSSASHCWNLTSMKGDITQSSIRQPSLNAPGMYIAWFYGAKRGAASLDFECKDDAGNVTQTFHAEFSILNPGEFAQ